MTVMYDFYSFAIMVSLISFLGFIVENIWLAITKGYVDNRNMNTPFLLGYGLLVLAMYFTVGIPETISVPPSLNGRDKAYAQYAIYFIFALLFVSIGELALGFIVEKICNIEYWNYSSIPLHFTKYTSLPTSIGFATMITFFMDTFFTPIMSKITMIDSIFMKVFSIFIIAVLIVDFVSSFYMMIKNQDFYIKWRKELKRHPKNYKYHFKM